MKPVLHAGGKYQLERVGRGVGCVNLGTLLRN